MFYIYDIKGGRKRATKYDSKISDLSGKVAFSWTKTVDGPNVKGMKHKKYGFHVPCSGVY